MIKVVILTAGLGERLRPLTYLVPKPYLPLRDGLIIEYILNWVKSQGFKYDDVIIVTAYMADKVISLLGNLISGVKFVIADQLLGTAGQLWYVRDFIYDNDDVIIINGDVLTDVPLAKALDYHRSSNADVTIISIRYRLTARYGVLDVSPSGEFRGWLEKPTITLPIVTGIYIMKGSLIKRLSKERLDMNKYVEYLRQSGMRIMVFLTDGNYVDLGVPQDYLNSLVT
ncbi:nucleotidyltransferase family protein [Vulcanisaeta distributa]|uniref:Nucleotidyl transferase n=1 Tax=Vulcanisaeta distributa (strain DSM 14429 / JCM 11212 / NBRC 100878 / IC-017) TaxID=572478 RepID=E1QTA7_VULDI|nr:nucleotidyltransferase family protein [Vulcanisaeta distributa]ADN50900.1 Nucleotidyl transferase [Vulcanisaeta distributa DSM 14429]